MKRIAALATLTVAFAYVTPTYADPAPAVDAAESAKVKEVTKIEVSPIEIESEAPAEQSWWQALVYDVLVDVVLPIFLPVLAALVFWLLRRLGLKIELEKLDELAAAAASYAEKKASTWLKEKGVKSSGAEKEAWAWELIAAVDARLNASTKARRALRALIISRIANAEQAQADSETSKSIAAPEA